MSPALAALIISPLAVALEPITAGSAGGGPWHQHHESYLSATNPSVHGSRTLPVTAHRLVYPAVPSDLVAMGREPKATQTSPTQAYDIR